MLRRLAGLPLVRPLSDCAPRVEIASASASPCGCGSAVPADDSYLLQTCTDAANPGGDWNNQDDMCLVEDRTGS